ncbi:MAG TPA: transporter substrate-binding domain-containing protein [Candidatus Methylomirabilis sp.]|nr:transporter substrate-binding domain-containing protein [Candidatus Methylomirabilis sp.]
MRRIGFLTLLPVACLIAGVSYAQAPAKPPAKSAAPSGEKEYALPNVAKRKWTGDLDGMIKRRQIRILTAYSKTFYFVDRGVQRGLAYDLGQLFETELNKKLKTKNIKVHVLYVPVDRDDIIPALLEGRGDVAMANLTITPERLKRVDFANPTARNVSEIVVTGPGAEPIASVQDLAGKEVYIRKSSSYFESIEKLNAELAKTGKAPVKVRPAPETLESEDILEMVNAGLVKVTIADEHIAVFWKRVFPKLSLHPEVAVRTGGETGWMLRKDSPQLKAALNSFVARFPEGSASRNMLLQKYLKSTKWAKEATSREEIAKFERLVQFFQTYGDRYDMDYLLMIAQGYQESQLNQEAKSPVGAIGVMQVMPATGKELAVGDITQIEPNIHAGVKYMRFMMDQFYANEPMDRLNKGLFTFASYNAGPGRMQQLRRLAAKRGLEPNVWFNNVERIAAEKIGRETVTYVSNIYKYYLAYRMITEQHGEREKAKEAVKEGTGK